MKIDDKLLKDSLIESKIPANDFALISKENKTKILNKYVDNTQLNSGRFLRYFECLKDLGKVYYGVEAIRAILELSLEGDFFIFTEKGDDIYKIFGWNNIKLIIPQLPSSLDVYITDVNLDTMICLTSEDNVIISGKNPFTR